MSVCRICGNQPCPHIIDARDADVDDLDAYEKMACAVIADMKARALQVRDENRARLDAINAQFEGLKGARAYAASATSKVLNDLARQADKGRAALAALADLIAAIDAKDEERTVAALDAARTLLNPSAAVPPAAESPASSSPPATAQGPFPDEVAP
jgi:hypothetical protein